MDEPAQKPVQVVPDALKRLEVAIAKATQVPNHPMLATLEACHAHLSAFARISADVNLGVQILSQRLRKPLTPDEIKGISQETADATKAAIGRLHRDYKLRTILLATGVLVGIGLASGYGGFFLGRQSGIEATDTFRQMSMGNRTQWLDLMHANGNIVKAVGLCGKPDAPLVVVKDGRRACAVPLFLD